jgi:hypothetical protein
MIGAVHAYTIVDAGYRSWLPGWLYWHRVRYDRLFVMLLDGDEECRRLIREYGAEEMVSLAVYGHGLGAIEAFITDRYRLIYDHAASFGTRVWYSVIDVDEIVDPMLDVRALARWCQRRGRVVAFAHMIDRVHQSGLPRPMVPPVYQFSAFPIRVCFGRDMTGWNYSKPFLRRSDFWGLHRIDNVRHANGNGCHVSFELCHFDFTDKTQSRCQVKLDAAKRKWVGWWKQYETLANACETGIDVEKLALPPYDYAGALTSLGGDDAAAIFLPEGPD